MSQSPIEAGDLFENLCLDRRAGRLDVLVIEPDNLLMLADDAGFPQRRQAVIHRDQVDAGAAGTAARARAPFVVADHGNQRGVPTEGDGRWRRCSQLRQAPVSMTSPSTRGRALPARCGCNRQEAYRRGWRHPPPTRANW